MWFDWALAIALWVASTIAVAAGGPLPGNPRLANLEIAVWPEFDRRGAALVILRGEIAPDVTLPVTIRLPIPGTSFSPAQVAYSPGTGNALLNLKHDRSEAGGVATLTFEAPARAFHVEFYDRLAATGTRRSYSYVWSGAIRSDRIAIVVQEPAAASDIAVTPTLGNPAQGPDGLRYRSSAPSSPPTAEPIEIKVTYTKSDERTSSEILGAKGAAAPKAPEPPAASGSPASGKSRVLWIVAVVVLLAALGTVAWSRQLRGTGAGDRTPDPAVRKANASAPSTKSARAARKGSAPTGVATAASRPSSVAAAPVLPQPAGIAKAADRAWALVFAAWAIAAASTLGALFFSEVMELPPCVLCWYQRIAMFPLVVLLPLGLFPFDPNVVRYALPLTLAGWVIALFQLLLIAGVVPESVKPCTQGVPCDEVQIVWLGFISIPLLSFIAFSAIGALLIAARRRIDK